MSMGMRSAPKSMFPVMRMKKTLKQKTTNQRHVMKAMVLMNMAASPSVHSNFNSPITKASTLKVQLTGTVQQLNLQTLTVSLSSW